MNPFSKRIHQIKNPDLDLPKGTRNPFLDLKSIFGFTERNTPLECLLSFKEESLFLSSSWLRRSKGGCVWIALAWVASVSVRFRSKGRGTRDKDHAKNGASKIAGRGVGFGGKALIPFLARPKLKIPFLDLSLLRTQTKTLVTQARIESISLNFWSTVKTCE